MPLEYSTLFKGERVAPTWRDKRFTEGVGVVADRLTFNAEDVRACLASERAGFKRFVHQQGFVYFDLRRKANIKSDIASLPWTEQHNNFVNFHQDSTRSDIVTALFWSHKRKRRFGTGLTTVTAHDEGLRNAPQYEEDYIQYNNSIDEWLLEHLRERGELYEQDLHPNCVIAFSDEYMRHTPLGGMRLGQARKYPIKRMLL